MYRLGLRSIVGLVLLSMFALTVEARRGEAPISERSSLRDLQEVEVFSLDPVNPAALLAEDESKAGQTGPLRFALPVDVEASLDSHGTWEELADGRRVWRLRVHAPNSTDLNIGFSRYVVPPGAKLYIISEEHDYFQGPYTADDNRRHGQLWTPVVPGDRVVIELELPAVTSFPAELELTRVGCGYRSLFDSSADLDKQGSCNNDVICPVGDPWRAEIRSVAVYGTSGSTFCTGSMIMDVPRDFRPFFLTANHCGINAGNAPSVVAYWNYESPTCDALSGGILSDNTSGATFRASDSNNDMCLIEFDSPPDEAYGVYWAGWDATGVVPSGSVGIHHPSTDEKAISLNTNALTTVNSCIGGGGSNTHWEVDDWEDGTTEPGSSGSGLWDPDTHLLVGYLSGGLASCTLIDYDCYGKFSVGWNAGLSTWLDPAATGVLTVPGSDPQPTLGYVGHVAADVCASEPGNVNGVWEPGETLTVTVTLDATGDFTGVNGTLSSLTPGVSVVDPTATWPDITSGASAAGTTFSIHIGDTVACLTDVNLTLQVTANEGGPFDFQFGGEIGASLVPDVPKPLQDNGTTNSTLIIGENQNLTDVDLRAQIDHTWVGELEVVLVHPDGTEVTLLDQPGIPGSAFGCVDDDLDVTFDDAAATDIESHCEGTNPWYSGTAMPASPLSALNGKPSAGTWTLRVIDHLSGFGGTLQSWELITTPVVSAGQCSVCTGGGQIFADGFESGTTNGWSGTN